MSVELALLLAVALATATWVVVSFHYQRRLQPLEGENEHLRSRVEGFTAELSEAAKALKSSQARLVQNEKMSSLGTMVAGVAHEINTPLAYSSSNMVVIGELQAELGNLMEEALELARLSKDPTAGVEDINAQSALIGAIAEAIERDGIFADIETLLADSNTALLEISELVQSLKNFSRIDRKKVDSINLNDSLDAAIKIANSTFKDKVEIVKRYGTIPTIKCVPSQINQVLLNMLINASQAISDRGRITLTTRIKDEAVQVLIDDNGKGIPTDVLPRIFDPFFTTKDVGEGTGIGLSICYQIVKRHGGGIKVQSAAGKGTRFTISLPCEQPVAVSGPNRQPSDEVTA